MGIAVRAVFQMFPPHHHHHITLQNLNVILSQNLNQIHSLLAILLLHIPATAVAAGALLILRGQQMQKQIKLLIQLVLILKTIM